MNRARLDQITSVYPTLNIALVGDFCLDRYLEIDPARAETSIETGLPVHNVVRLRSQPGGAGTILNNLCALGISAVFPVGFCGDDGEGYELLQALRARPGVRLDHFRQTPDRRTFTYCKPLLVEPGKPPRELNRLDSKNWSPTPASVERHLVDSLQVLAPHVDAVIVLDQVDIPDTGVVTRGMLAALGAVAAAHPGLPIIADSRRSLRGFPPVSYKMNTAELALLTGSAASVEVRDLVSTAGSLAQTNQRPVFITLSERGIVGAAPDGTGWHQPCLPVRGEIDIVGAGDAVTANLAAALAGGAEVPEALELSMAAASIVIHQLGTTGTASVAELREVLGLGRSTARGTHPII